MVLLISCSIQPALQNHHLGGYQPLFPGYTFFLKGLGAFVCNNLAGVGLGLGTAAHFEIRHRQLHHEDGDLLLQLRRTDGELASLLLG